MGELLTFVVVLLLFFFFFVVSLTARLNFSLLPFSCAFVCVLL